MVTDSTSDTLLSKGFKNGSIVARSVLRRSNTFWQKGRRSWSRRIPGAQGQSPGYFGERRKSCADHGITADFDAYFAGRAEGLSHFCSPYNGYRLGAQGYQYSGICPASPLCGILARQSHCTVVP